MLQFLGPEFIPNLKRYFLGKTDAISGCLVGGLSNNWLVCGWFGWFMGSLWLVGMVCR